MALAGVGLLINALATLFPPALAHLLSSYAFGMDGVGEIPFALWLVVMGVNSEQWKEQANDAIGAPA